MATTGARRGASQQCNRPTWLVTECFENTREWSTCAASFGLVQRPQRFQLQKRFVPWPAEEGLCPWTPLGAPPQTLAMWLTWTTYVQFPRTCIRIHKFDGTLQAVQCHQPSIRQIQTMSTVRLIASSTASYRQAK